MTRILHNAVLAAFADWQCRRTTAESMAAADWRHMACYPTGEQRVVAAFTAASNTTLNKNDQRDFSMHQQKDNTDSNDANCSFSKAYIHESKVNQEQKESPSLSDESTRKSRWQRFVDKLAGGPPDPEKIEAAKRQGWFKQYFVTLVMVATTCVAGIYPELVSRLNDAPDPAQLQTLQVRILQTREKEPHFQVQMPGGGVRNIEWPVVVSFHGGYRFLLWTDEQRAALVGCSATIQVAPIRWTIRDRYRVWSLSCPATGFEISMEQAVQRIRRSLKLRTPVFVAVFVPLLMLIIAIFLREKRGVL